MWQAFKGAPTVFINGKAAYRMNDPSKHCGGMGQLIEGSSDVIVGDSSSGGGAGGGGSSGGGSNGGGSGGNTSPGNNPDNPNPGNDPSNPNPGNNPDNPNPPSPGDPDSPVTPPGNDPNEPNNDKGWIDVLVVDGLGQPIANATVTASGASNRMGTSAADGTLRLAELVPGPYQLDFERSPYEPASIPFTVVAGTPPANGPASPQTSDSPRSALVPFALRDGDPPPSAKPTPTPSQPLTTGPNNIVMSMVVWIEVVITESPESLTDPAREGAGAGGVQPWSQDRLIVTLHFKGKPSDPISLPVFPHTDGSKRGVTAFPLPTQPSADGLTATLSLERGGTKNMPIVWRLDPAEPLDTQSLRGSTSPHIVERKMSTRLRITLISFFLPFMDINKAGAIDTDLLDLAKDAHIDDITINSILQFVDDTRNPLVKNKKGPRMRLLSTQLDVFPLSKYLTQMISETHKRGMQLVVGFSPVGGYARFKDFVDYMTTADDAAIDKLVDLLTDTTKWEIDNEPSVFFDIDGIQFDFETDGLGPTQKENIRKLYQGTARKLAAMKSEAFASYANAAQGEDNPNPFMKAQPFSFVQDNPNLIARPQCLDGPHTIPADQIRATMKKALESGIHPAQLQPMINFSELPKDFDKLIQDTLLPNRLGVMLYQFPNVPSADPQNFQANRDAAIASRAKQVAFLQHVVSWNKALNPNESVPSIPPVPGQPLQAPRAKN